jgi:hypothetical protein
VPGLIAFLELSQRTTELLDTCLTAGEKVRSDDSEGFSSRARDDPAR